MRPTQTLLGGGGGPPVGKFNRYALCPKRPWSIGERATRRRAGLGPAAPRRCSAVGLLFAVLPRAIGSISYRTSLLTRDTKPCRYIGGWGDFGGLKQKGIITYGISPNRQRPLAGAANAAVFNTWRRFRGQVLYVVPPFVAAYYAMQWAIHRNEYLYSKEGRHELET
ncbi:hypothetical protein RB601_001377 [Gaeumannomyces tritici]